LFKYNTRTHTRTYGLEFDLCRMYWWWNFGGNIKQWRHDDMF
jgi:hypothetical protein